MDTVYFAIEFRDPGKCKAGFFGVKIQMMRSVCSSELSHRKSLKVARATVAYDEVTRPSLAYIPLPNQVCDTCTPYIQPDVLADVLRPGYVALAVALLLLLECRYYLSGRVSACQRNKRWLPQISQNPSAPAVIPEGE